MHAGFAFADITPPIGALLDGFLARWQPSTGVDAPLWVSVLCLDDGSTQSLIVSFDLLGLTRTTAERWLALLSERFGMASDHIVFACSHTHAGPMSFPIRGAGVEDGAYMKRVEAALLDAAARAVADLREARATWSEAPVAIGMNRRERHGQTTTLGRNPDGPTDTAVRVLLLERESRPIVLFGHACHPYCLGPQHLSISSDFCGHAVLSLRGRGYDALYVNGCAGNIAPIANGEGPAAAAREGRRLADAVAAAAEADGALRVGETATLAVRSARVALPHDRVEPIESVRCGVQAQIQMHRPSEGADDTGFRRFETAMLHWLDDLAAALNAEGQLPPIETRISVLSLGGRSVVFLPGEVFFEIGQRVGAIVGDARTWAVGYSHDFIGYVPTPEEMPFGGYEVDDAHRFLGLWRVGPTAAGVLAEAAAELVRATKTAGAKR